MFADIATGETEAADVVFLAAIILAAVAVLAVRFVGRGNPATVADALMAASVGLIAWGLLLQ